MKEQVRASGLKMTKSLGARGQSLEPHLCKTLAQQAGLVSARLGTWGTPAEEDTEVISIAQMGNLRQRGSMTSSESLSK